MKLTFIPVLRNPSGCFHPRGQAKQLLKLSKNILLAMKITAFILLVACLHASAGSFSQNVTLKADNMPFREVLSEV